MAKKVNGIGFLVILALLAFLLIDMVLYHTRDPDEVEYKTHIPPPDPNREAFVFDFYENKWVYKDELPGRANDYQKPSRQRINEYKKPSRQRNQPDIQQYLEEHVDGYKEKTWWGEEWEYNDDDDDDDDW